MGTGEGPRSSGPRAHEPRAATYHGREQGAGQRSCSEEEKEGSPAQCDERREGGHDERREGGHEQGGQVGEQAAAKAAGKWRHRAKKNRGRAKHGKGGPGSTRDGLCRRANLKGRFPLRHINPHHAQPKPAPDGHQRDWRQGHLRSRMKGLAGNCAGSSHSQAIPRGYKGLGFAEVSA